MSDMSFKQAKEISQRLELSEITLNKTLDNIQTATKILEKNTKNNKFSTSDTKITNLKILLGLNIGFIIGLLVSKYFL